MSHIFEDGASVNGGQVLVVRVGVVNHEVTEEAELADGGFACLLYIINLLLLENEISNLLWKVLRVHRNVLQIYKMDFFGLVLRIMLEILREGHQLYLFDIVEDEAKVEYLLLVNIRHNRNMISALVHRVVLVSLGVIVVLVIQDLHGVFILYVDIIQTHLNIVQALYQGRVLVARVVLALRCAQVAFHPR